MLDRDSIRFTSLLSLFFSIILISTHSVQSRWSSNLLQSDSLAKLSNQFLATNDKPRTNTIWQYEDCGQPTDAISITNFEVDPDPPKPGENLTIYGTGTVHQLIEPGAYADVTVKLGSFIKLLQKRFDICEELTKSNLTLRCPIEPGDYEITQTVELPKEIPRAKFTVEVRAYTSNEDDLACANVMIDFLKS